MNGDCPYAEIMRSAADTYLLRTGMNGSPSHVDGGDLRFWVFLVMVGGVWSRQVYSRRDDSVFEGRDKPLLASDNLPVT